MKTAISIPDDLFEAAERLARKLGKPRSVLYAEAVAEYLARRDAGAVTDAMNAVCQAVTGDEDGRFVAEAARRALECTEW
jgi:predicted transcriptional regulator